MTRRWTCRWPMDRCWRRAWAHRAVRHTICEPYSALRCARCCRPPVARFSLPDPISDHSGRLRCGSATSWLRSSTWPPMPDVVERDVPTGEGRLLHTFDSGGDGPVVLFHHGSPATGALLPPMLSATSARGVRLIGYARPSYLGSTAVPGRDVALRGCRRRGNPRRVGCAEVPHVRSIRRRPARAGLCCLIAGSGPSGRHPGRDRAIHTGLRLVRRHGGTGCVARGPAGQGVSAEIRRDR